MKRCDNCGWYNNDSLSVCEKCGEPLGSYLEPETSDDSVEEPSVSFAPASPYSETEPKPVVPEDSLANKTLRVGEGVRSKAEKSFGATVRDVSAVMEGLEGGPGVKTCPKCHYPLAGNPDTCPNCGEPLPHRTSKDAARFNATVREGMTPPKPDTPDAPDASAAPAASAAPVPPSAGKATMRDIPKELLQDAPAGAGPRRDDTQEIFKLVPVAGTEGPSVYMRVGDLVQIGNKRYRFVK